MFSLYDKVRIKPKNIVGEIVDISIVANQKRYIVESAEPYVEGGYGGVWKLFDCSSAEIEKI